MHYQLKKDAYLTVIDAPGNQHANIAFKQWAKFIKVGVHNGYVTLTDGKVNVFVSKKRIDEIFDVIEKKLVFGDPKWGEDKK